MPCSYVRRFIILFSKGFRCDIDGLITTYAHKMDSQVSKGEVGMTAAFEMNHMM